MAKGYAWNQPATVYVYAYGIAYEKFSNENNDVL